MPLTLALESFGLMAGITGIASTGGFSAVTDGAGAAAVGAGTDVGGGRSIGGAGGALAGAGAGLASTTRAPLVEFVAGAGAGADAAGADDSTGAGGGEYWLAGTSSNMLELLDGAGVAAIVVALAEDAEPETLEALRGADDTDVTGLAPGLAAIPVAAPAGEVRRNS